MDENDRGRDNVAWGGVTANDMLMMMTMMMLVLVLMMIMMASRMMLVIEEDRMLHGAGCRAWLQMISEEKSVKAEGRQGTVPGTPFVPENPKLVKSKHLKGQSGLSVCVVYRENFNIGNLAQNYFMFFYISWRYAISFLKTFQMRKFSLSPSQSQSPLPGRLFENRLKFRKLCC